MELSFETSRRKIADACAVIPGGVNSAFRTGMSPTPLVIDHAQGPYVFDADGNRLIDYYLSMGPMILGHSPPEVRQAVERQLGRGILYGGQSEVEFEAARLVCKMVPCAERVRFSSSGSEAVQAAMRLARASSGKQTVLKFEGHYHGWFDNILWSTAPPEGANGKVAGSRGQLDSAGAGIDVLPWNDEAALRQRLAQGDVAAVLMEAVMCNAGAVLPGPGYLEAAQSACREHGALLVFDEVITGFRVGPGGAQARLGITPDMAVFAKAMANGFQVAALTGRAEVMELCTQGVVHGGTYNSQAVSMAACVATLQRLSQPGAYDGIEARGRRLMDGIAAHLRDAGITAVVTGYPQIFHVAFGLTGPAHNWADLRRMDRARYVAFTTALLRRGVRALERGAWFMSTEHDDAVVEATLSAVREAAREVA